MKVLDLAKVRESSNGLPAGGYVCEITKVEDNPKKEYLYIEFDIIEGEYKHYFEALNEVRGFWGGNMYKSYKEKALPMLKRFCNAVTNSNPNYIFDAGEQNHDEKTLVGKQIGIVMREEEYMGNDGFIKSRVIADYEVTVDKIHSKDYKVNPKKLLDTSKAPTTDTDPEELFG